MRNEVFRDTEWRVLAIFVAAPLAVRYVIINDFVKTTLTNASRYDPPALPLALATSWRRSFRPGLCSFGFSPDVAAYIILIEAACRTFTVSVM